MQEPFPGAGHRYLVDFVRFRVILAFSSNTSLTYTVLNPDGSSGQIETVHIQVESITESIFLVTWQEADKTTVVHVEDYARRTIVTNITNPDSSFQQFHGTFVQIDATQAATATPLSYARDIRPLFRAGDITCMSARGVLLDDPNWMRIASNANRVYSALFSGDMPPDDAWPDDKIALFKAWIDGGLNP